MVKNKAVELDFVELDWWGLQGFTTVHAAASVIIRGNVGLPRVGLLTHLSPLAFSTQQRISLSVLMETVPGAVPSQVCRQPKNRENQFQFLVGTITSAVLSQVCRQLKNRENQFQFLMGTIPSAVLSQICRQPKSCAICGTVLMFT